jgi:outer membrane biosynthesis protein TonB
LRKTKAEVLEMVWAYLYSGRPEQAWAELESAWPVGDVGRVKAAIVAARARGIEAQVAKVASATRPPTWSERTYVYKYLKPAAGDVVQPSPFPGLPLVKAPKLGDNGSPASLAADTEPQPISLWRPSPSAPEQAQALGEETVWLTIDEAGKVNSARMLAPKSDPELLQAAKDWKFIPALRDGRPVAYELKMEVRPYQ